MPETRAGRAAVLARVPIFSDLPDAELKFLSDRAVTKRYASGDLISAKATPVPVSTSSRLATSAFSRLRPGGREGCSFQALLYGQVVDLNRRDPWRVGTGRARGTEGSHGVSANHGNRAWRVKRNKALQWNRCQRVCCLRCLNARLGQIKGGDRALQYTHEGLCGTVGSEVDVHFPKQ